MESLRIIPCLDIKDGRVVKGVSFVNLKDAGDPVELASLYERQGADEIVFLDISASHEGRGTLVELVRATADDVFIPFTVGGGIGTLDQATAILRAGADKVSLNSQAVKSVGLVSEIASIFGSQAVVVAIDAKLIQGRYRVFTHGGRVETELDAVEWAQTVEKHGAGELLVTSMDRDGTKSGFDLRLIQEISDATSVPVIASGGVGEVGHFVQGAQSGASGLLAASVFHYGEISIGEVKQALSKSGLVVRPTAQTLKGVNSEER